MKLYKNPPNIPWANKDELIFRNSIPQIFNNLPGISFLDKSTFEIKGYIGSGTLSVVAKVVDKSGTYIAKSTADNSAQIEGAFYNEWNKYSKNILEVIEIIKPSTESSYPILITKFINKDTTYNISKNEPIDYKVYTEIAKSLALMHKSKASGFGRASLDKNGILFGKFKNFNEFLVEEFITKSNIDSLLKNKLIKKSDIKKIEIAINQLSKDFSQGSLTHNDLGTHNTLGKSNITILDPLAPSISHPMLDLACSIMWATIEKVPEEVITAIINNYSKISTISKQTLNAAIYLRIISKYSYWTYKGKFHKDALNWMDLTKDILNKTSKLL